MDFSESELKAFADDVLERFSNPFIRHELKSIALNSISKFKVRVLPSLLSYWEKNQIWPEHLIKGFAALLIFYSGEYQGTELPVNDNPELMAEFNSVWALGSTQETVTKLISERTYWGEDLNCYEELVDAVTEAVDGLLSA
jgi:tagaturonate reductase